MATKLKQHTIFSNVAQKFDNSLLKNLKDELQLDIILYGSDKLKDTVNKGIFLHTIIFIKNTKHFEKRLFGHYCNFVIIVFLIGNTAYSLLHPFILIIHQFILPSFARE